MKENSRGTIICSTIEGIMPFLFKNFHHILHRFTNDEYNLYGNQIKVINAVRILGDASPAKLSRILIIPKGSLTTILSSLVESGLLKKSYSKTDPRRYTVSITKKAKLLLKEKRKIDAVKYEELFAALSEDDLTKIMDGIKVIQQYFQSKEEGS